jgi:hypothetical protein
MLDSNLKAEDTSDLQEMLEHYRITKVLAEYAHGCDRLHRDMMAGTYMVGSWDDHGSYKGDGHEFVDYCMTHIPGTYKSCTHQLGQSLIKVDGNEAGAETYFIAVLRRDKDGGEVLDQIAGRYVDKLQRVDGKWKIKKRDCVRDWSITIPVTDNFSKNDPFIVGQLKWGTDASFEVLGY